MFFEILLPIASVLVNPFLIMMIGVIGGFFSSLFGIGGGIIVTPCLIMVGISPLVAVISQLHASIGTSFMGFLEYWRYRDVDFALAWYIFLGAFLGSVTEVFLLDWLDAMGSIQNFLAIVYVIVLIALGLLLVIQNIIATMNHTDKSQHVSMKRWMIYIPYHRIFTRSRVEMSILVPIVVGFATGILTSTLGGGNSVFIMPIVTYLIGRSSPVVSGTSLLASALISVFVTLIHAMSHATGDFILIILIILGSYFGSKMGVIIRYKAPKNILSIIGGAIILLIGCNFALDLPSTPLDKFISHSLDFVRYTDDFNGWFYGHFLRNFSIKTPFLYATTSVTTILVMSFILHKISAVFSFIISKVRN